MIALQDYYRHRVSPAAYDLFAIFARFEYAMKVGGFRRDQTAEAAWRKFANSLPQDTFLIMREAPEVQIYFDEPPDSLVVDNDDGVCWARSPTVPVDMLSLLECIKVARNNLFHGDKRHDNRRDNELAVSALFVLNKLYELVEFEPRFHGFIDAMEYGL